jgi:hypothetical protein
MSVKINSNFVICPFDDDHSFHYNATAVIKENASTKSLKIISMNEFAFYNPQTISSHFYPESLVYLNFVIFCYVFIFKLLLFVLNRKFIFFVLLTFHIYSGDKFVFAVF